jgi:hypothetical protein
MVKGRAAGTGHLLGCLDAPAALHSAQRSTSFHRHFSPLTPHYQPAFQHMLYTLNGVAGLFAGFGGRDLGPLKAEPLARQQAALTLQHRPAAQQQETKPVMRRVGLVAPDLWVEKPACCDKFASSSVASSSAS